MSRKQYVFTLVETESNKAFSTAFSSKSFIITAAGAFCLICLAVYTLLSGAGTLERELNISRLQKENSSLRISLSDWNSRIQTLESSLEKLRAANQRIRDLTDPVLTQSRLGVGGPPSSHISAFSPVSAAAETDMSLSRLEAKVLHTEKSLTFLEQSLNRRLSEIAHYPSIRPVRGGWFSSGFGRRLDPFTGKEEDHPGLDICVPTGTDVYAAADGTVRKVSHTVIKNKGYGKYIIVNHGYGYETLYAHLSKILVKKGDRIKRWDIIARSGDTGKSTAPHLHYGVYARGNPRNPFYFILDS